MSSLQVRATLQRPGFTLAVDLCLPCRGVTVLYGHSGSGKTTCLRVMAGLERAPTGYVALGDEVWQDEACGLFVPTHRRPLGYVFQEASLFPHLSVRANLDYGRQRRPGVAAGVDDVVDLLGIGHLLARLPDGLSGGERQRVAIARAVLAAPRLLLLDEPLAALDLRRKQEILPYLERLRDELSLPMVYVSHAPDEVARLADHVVLFDQGQVVVSGPLSATLARIDLPPLFADEAGVVVDTVLVAQEADELSCLAFAGGLLRVARRAEPVGSSLRCRIHARDVSLVLEQPVSSSILNILPATVESLADSDTPGQMLVRVQVGSTPILARITRRSCRELALQAGMPVWVQIKAVALLA